MTIMTSDRTGKNKLLIEFIRVVAIRTDKNRRITPASELANEITENTATTKANHFS